MRDTGRSGAGRETTAAAWSIYPAETGKPERPAPLKKPALRLSPGSYFPRLPRPRRRTCASENESSSVGRASLADYRVDNGFRGSFRILFLDQPRKRGFERGHLLKSLQVFDTAVGELPSLLQNDHVRTNFLDHFEHMRAVEDGFPLAAEPGHQLAENHGRYYIQPRERLVKTPEGPDCAAARQSGECAA